MHSIDSPGRPLRSYLALSLVSGSVLALQVVFTRIFSIMIWYHFAYLVVGVALLGGGAAGVYLAIRQWNTTTLSRWIGRFAALFSFSILLALIVIIVIHFDPLGDRSALPQTLIGLAVYFAAMFTVFFLGGLVIASAFSAWGKKAHRLYFADLLGASIGTLVVLWIIWQIGGPATILLIAFLVLVAGVLFGLEVTGLAKLGVAVVALVQIGLFLFTMFVSSVQLPVPQSKELGWAMSALGVNEPEYTRWNPVARVDVLPPMTAAVPGVVGGISSVFHSAEEQNQDDSKPVTFRVRFVTLDGTSVTLLHQFEGDLSHFEILDHSIVSAPFQVGIDEPKVLNIGVGGGLDIILARLFNAKDITAVELNSDVVELLTGPYAEFTGRLADDPRTRIIAAEGRSFLMRDDARYDIIQGIGLDNFAALSGGVYVLSESYLYTVDAVELALTRLSPEGIFAWTRTVYEPPREMLRLAGLAAEALRRQHVTNPERHIAIVANEDSRYATLLVSNAPFALPQIQQLRKWVSANGFNLLHDPHQSLNTPFTDYLSTPDPRAFEATYPFNIFPTTDDKPFFYDYFKWSDLQFGFDGTGDVNLRFPIGNLVLLVMLGFSVLAAVVFIVYPLLRYRRGGLRTPYATPMLAYFSLLGMGYIMIEVVLIQRFTLFIGYPTLAITTTIFSMLLFSAFGSLVARRVCKRPWHLRALLLALSVSILVYVLILPQAFELLFPLSDTMRIAVSVVLIGPLAFLMGMPFPTGLRRLGIQASHLIPWAWGVNGVFSVLGSVVVILISMQTNFTAALVTAGLCYAAVAILSTSLWNVRVVEAESKSGASTVVPIPAQRTEL